MNEATNATDDYDDNAPWPAYIWRDAHDHEFCMLAVSFPNDDSENPLRLVIGNIQLNHANSFLKDSVVRRCENAKPGEIVSITEND